jgi:hypothetical protein
MDITPYPLDWENELDFKRMAQVVKTVAATEGISIVWGGDWKSLKDMPHFELGEGE